MTEPRFELEVHVKALACFANPRNHPRSSVAAPAAGAEPARDLRPAPRPPHVTLPRAISLFPAEPRLSLLHI